MWERAMMAYWAVNDSVMDWQMMCLFYCSSVTGLFSPAPPPLPRYDWTVAVIETGAASLSRRWVAVTHLSLSTKTNIFSPDKENNNKQNNNNNLKKKRGGGGGGGGRGELAATLIPPTRPRPVSGTLPPAKEKECRKGMWVRRSHNTLKQLGLAVLRPSLWRLALPVHSAVENRHAARQHWVKICGQTSDYFEMGATISSVWLQWEIGNSAWRIKRGSEINPPTDTLVTGLRVA